MLTAPRDSRCNLRVMSSVASYVLNVQADTGKILSYKLSRCEHLLNAAITPYCQLNKIRSMIYEPSDRNKLLMLQFHTSKMKCLWLVRSRSRSSLRSYAE